MLLIFDIKYDFYETCSNVICMYVQYQYPPISTPSEAKKNFDITGLH